MIQMVTRGRWVMLRSCSVCMRDDTCVGAREIGERDSEGDRGRVVLVWRTAEESRALRLLDEVGLLEQALQVGLALGATAALADGLLGQLELVALQSELQGGRESARQAMLRTQASHSPCAPRSSWS